MPTTRKREQWDSQCDFILSCIGYSVGVGNIWRFPYLCYKHGGGTFLIPYLIMLLAVGIPMYVMELTLGQYASLGPNKLFQKLSPLFSGLGYAMLLMTAFVCFTYNMVIAWVVFYAAASFTSELAWSRCGHDYNTRDCYTIADDDFCVNSSDRAKLFWNNTCYPVSEFCMQHDFSPYNNTHCINSTAEQAMLADIFLPCRSPSAGQRGVLRQQCFRCEKP
ncbi:sodium- and chloride-dependent creatine transporter 1-like [Pollicipes pollicipes]|uniref:sodium- and chloride-dependent creatine transporter 1-like n=1 Tax=Pollicipes pollicipes TaxID=41117 RepID=UPI0018851604|nr:sodium- and chloride-dependent creatine transporter 1-like [Pollicipes pollicipes]